MSLQPFMPHCTDGRTPDRAGSRGSRKEACKSDGGWEIITVIIKGDEMKENRKMKASVGEKGEQKA